MKENGKAREIPRYIRLYFTSGNSQAANRSIGVREFQVIGTKKSESGYETITGNIALNKTASASGVRGGNAESDCKSLQLTDRSRILPDGLHLQ